ncbi:TerD family protein [Streptomyces sp. ALI-76-A]|uniref:TerD family protein n=1 Tax=Streptomyces sp. ALI-76-A TaxID=3025736 RepID=UPI00256F3642|nr:TerD family protein [Streptomyces sp. ALI-76-A]MDL5199290.1 TerD family protein [Streptomyces sp. ALI-76-A]
MGSVSTGLSKVEVKLKWDPSVWNEPPHHLDIIATAYSSEDPYGQPVYVVHFDSRSPDGTINMSRHSQTGQGFGYVEVMTLELDRLASSFARVVVGVAIHQSDHPKTFGDLTNAGVVVLEGYKELLKDDFARVAGSTATTVAEFSKDDSGRWEFHEMIRGFDSDPLVFTAEMGNAQRP